MFTHGSGKYSKLKRKGAVDGGGGGDVGVGDGGDDVGGGGGGRGGGDEGGGGGGSRSGDGSSLGSAQSIGSIKFGGTSRSVSRYGGGGGPSSIIPAGLPFAGRTEGGGSRSQIYGTKTYGSGYGSNFSARGVNGRPFPFYFWPVVWGEGALPLTSANLNASAEVGGVSAGAYLNARAEYGDVDNSARPGGPQFLVEFRALYDGALFHLVADNATATSLLADVLSNCSYFYPSVFYPVPIPLNPNDSSPRPEQVIQYYRASSIALTMDDYTNSATYAPEGIPDSPLPPFRQDVLDCLNQTIGRAAPLVDNGQPTMWAPSHVNLVGLVWVLWALLGFVRL